MSTEQDRVHGIMEDMAHGNSEGSKLRFNPATGLIESTGGSDPDSRDLGVTPDDLKFSEDDGKIAQKPGSYDGDQKSHCKKPVRLIFDEKTQKMRFATETDNLGNTDPEYSPGEMYFL